MQKNISTPLLIIGSGPAGWSAAIYAARANLNPVLVSGKTLGGQLTITTDVENYPGFAKTIQGPWLMEQCREQAINVGTKMIQDYIEEVDFSNSSNFISKGKNHIFSSKSVIIATGAQAKWLNLPSEEKFKGFGVSGCATCDAFFYKNKTVLVVGGGNTAAEEALFLSKFASKVILIHRGDKLRAEHILQKRLFSNEKIEIMWHHTLEEVIGEETPQKIVIGAKIYNSKNEKTTELKLDGIFIAIGHRPSTEIFKDHIDMDENGYIICPPGKVTTNIEGVFAAGDVHDKIYRQAVTAAGFGCMAALDAEKFLNN